MTVGFDARLTRQQSVGMKAYVRELHERLPRVAPEFSFVFVTRGGNFGWDEQISLPLALRRARVDLAHYPSPYVPLAAGRRFVVTIHDLIHLRFPEYFKAKVAPYYRLVVRRACDRAARVITDDRRTVGDLQRFLGVDPRKVRVIPLGVGERFYAPASPYAAARPYALYVGNHRAHKNLATLFAAWSALPETTALDLYVTGPDDFGGELERLRRPSREVRALGDVSVDELIGYYAGATALVSPAFCEGFGLPMLEAMAAGCPVLASDEAIPEVLEPAAATFPARSAEALRALLEEMASGGQRRIRMVERGKRIALELSWDRCARATADVYAEVFSTSC
ncbi:MAG TPA: glycosyltransferase family 1 protein [Candidatus Acidoferrales bacterium]|nr:glycosyltransferase family 1 protein [Candidatus Acidoferrales bacterium]